MADVIYIDEKENSIEVYFQNRKLQSLRYTLASFSVKTDFTKEMAAQVAARYADRTGFPIDEASLSISQRLELADIERDNPDLCVTYRVQLVPAV